MRRQEHSFTTFGASTTYYVFLDLQESKFVFRKFATILGIRISSDTTNTAVLPLHPVSMTTHTTLCT